MDRVHRQQLKHDKFVEQVGHTLEYAAGHREQVTKYGIAALAVLVIGFGIYFFLQYQENQRQQALRETYRILEGSVGSAPDQLGGLTFATADAKWQALEKSLRDVAGKYGSKREGYIAKFLLGVNLADRGNIAEAEKLLKDVADNANDAIASQAKLSLAHVYEAQNRVADAEKLLREVIANPTILVSKEQATITLGRILSKTKPEEARKLLEPLRGAERAAVSRNAMTAISEVPPSK